MSFYWAFQWYHSHADPIWTDGTFNGILRGLGENDSLKEPEVENLLALSL